MNGAHVFVKMLRAYGVDYVFGVPGDTNVPLYAAFEHFQAELTHVMCRDERSAGFMADAYARVSNKPAVMEVPSGAGSTYALPAIAEAQGSSVPVILITSETPLMGEGRGVITELDCARLYEPITKVSLQVKAAQKLPEIVRRAFRIATSGRPGAVHIAIPEDIFIQEVDPASVSFHAEPACRVYPSYPPTPVAAELERLMDHLARARRPLLVVGGGVNRSQGGAELTRFAETYRIPVVTTITGQNAILDTHELSIGIAGDNGFHPHANRALEEADLLIYIGCKNGSVVSIGWTFPAPRPDRQTIQIDIDPAVLGNNSENLLSMVGDARATLEMLNRIDPKPKMSIDPEWVPTLNEWRRLFWDHAGQQLQQRTSNKKLHPQLIMEALNRRLKKTHLLFADPGTPTPYLGRFLRLADGASRLFIPRAFGGLGYAIPAVVGGWFAEPSIRPIGLFGDGSLGMVIGELETLARLQVPAILLNFNNACFGWIKALQRLHGHKEFLSVDFTAQDYSVIARAYGLKAIRIETARQLDEGLDAAFAEPGPVFLDIVVESIAEEIPPVFNWLRKIGVDPLKVGDKALVADRLTAKQTLAS